MVLFVNACVREASRTLDLAKAVLSKEAGEIQEICLYPDGPEGLTCETLLERDALLRKKEYMHPAFRWARQFAEADVIVIAAPYWDLMFPAKLRAYLEQITVSGITFQYNADGIPQGLCKAQRLVYVTTAGGPIVHNFGFSYVEALASCFFGITDVRLVKAEGLDIWGADVNGIMEAAKSEIQDPVNDAICRVREMEQRFDDLQAGRLSGAEFREQLQILLRYYEGGQWLADYRMDEAGCFPADLKRGVLSEDAVYNFLTELEEDRL